MTSLFKASDVGLDYEPRLAEFEAAGKKAGLSPATKDKAPTILVIVDGQRDFVHTNGALSVPGAIDDMKRVAEWIYANAGQLSAITASLDTHEKMAIFHPMWWKNMGSGKNPDPFTPITYSEISQGKWVALKDPNWSVRYVHLLEEQAKKNLMIWPYHCLAGTDGQKLVPAIHEAIAYHAAARGVKPTFLTKGTVPQVEHYGIFAPEVPYPKNPNASLNTDMLDMIAKYERIYVAGEAKSHCVLETMKQMFSYFQAQPEVIKKIRFMMDGTSSVAHPTIDFEALAMHDLKEMEQKGVVMVTSRDPIK